MRELPQKDEALPDNPFWKRYLTRKYSALKLGFRSFKLMIRETLRFNWPNVVIRFAQIRLCMKVFFRLRHDK